MENTEEMKLFEMSENINELAAALSKAQSKIMKAHKDNTNPFFRSKYSDLASVWDAFRDPFTENGLSLSQFPIGKKHLLTMLMHSSGQFMKSIVEMNPSKDDPQGLGSAITYFRRYSAQAAAGVTPDDDDGNAASKNKDENTKPSYPPQNNVQYQKKSNNPTDKQLKRLFALINASVYEQHDVKKHIKNKYQCDSSKDLTIAQSNEICETLEGSKKDD